MKPTLRYWRAAVIAGIVAGVVASIFEVALWWMLSLDPAQMLFRDARFAAAIVLGHGVLPPPATFDAWVMIVATSIHFALSIAYGLIIAPMVARLNVELSLLVGAAFGLAIYVVNMDGFTFVFPWFAATRDPITAAAHVVFGISLAATCHAISRRAPTR